MSEILLVNPRRRRKMSALQRKYFGKRRRRKTGKKVARRRRSAVTVKVNPRRRRRSYAVMRHRAYRRKRNPSLRSFTGGIVPTIKSGVVGATGALGLDLLIGFLIGKLPVQLQTGYGLTATKIAGAVGIGMLGNVVMKGKGGDLAKGAMTVVLHNELRKIVQAQFPTLTLGEYFSAGGIVGYGTPEQGLLSTGYEQVGEYLSGMHGEVHDEDHSYNY